MPVLQGIQLLWKKLKFEKRSSVLILKLLKEFKTNKAAGTDNQAGRFLKTTQIHFVYLYMKLTSFLDKCKVAKIKPFYKRVLKTDPKNFRPISLLSLIFKITERIIHDQTMNVLSDNNILYKFQSGVEMVLTDFVIDVRYN